MKRKKIYVCAPWRGSGFEEQEANKVRTLRYWYYLYHNGYHPIAPQLLYGWLLNDNDPQERRDGMDAGQDELLRCDELWAFGNVISAGMKEEIRFAVEHGIPINYIRDDELSEILKKSKKPPASGHSTDGTGKNP